MGALREQLDAALQTGSLAAVLFALLIGVLVGFTPCVYPVLPIIVAYVGRIAGGKKLNAFFYSLVYVLGMALVYCTAGIIIVLAGGQVGQLWNNGWFLMGLGVIFVLISLWMFKVFSIPTPQFLKGAPKRGGTIGAFTIGAASGLVVGPCTVPGLAITLTLISTAAQEHSVGAFLFGVIVMFAYSIGLGSLVILCGTFSGLLATLPRSGKWLNVVEKVFASLMMAVAVFFFLAAGQAGNFPLLIPLLAGSGNGDAPPPAEAAPVEEDFAGYTAPINERLDAGEVKGSYEDVNSPSPSWALERLEGADLIQIDGFESRKGVVLVFFAKWCVACIEEIPYVRELHSKLADRDVVLFGVNSGERREVVEKLKRERGITYPVLLDATRSVTQSYNIRGLPHVIGIDANGVVRYDSSILPEDEEAFISMLEEGAASGE